MKYIILFLFVVGCVPSLPMPMHSPEPGEVDALVAEWRESGLPWRERCDDELRHLQIADADNADMRASTGYCATESPTCEETRVEGDVRATHNARVRAGCSLGICSSGSYRVMPRSAWPVSLAESRVVIIVSAYLTGARRREAIAHEGAHWLGHCAMDNMDTLHTDPRIWQGVVPRAVQRGEQ